MNKEAFRALQKAMPWTDLWSPGFKTDPRPYGPYEHCLINISAKLGMTLQRVEMADHYGDDYKLGPNRGSDGMALAIIVMSAMKAANVYPGGQIDLADLIETDLRRRGVDA